MKSTVRRRVFPESIYLERDDTVHHDNVFPVYMASSSHALDMILMRGTSVRSDGFVSVNHMSSSQTV